MPGKGSTVPASGLKGSGPSAGRVSSPWLEALTAGSNEVVALVDPDGTVRFISAALRTVLGYAPEELVPTPPPGLLHTVDHLDVPALLAELAQQPGGQTTITYRLCHRNGSWRHLESTASNCLDVEAIGALVVHTRDITHITGMDRVTGLQDRASFVEAVAEAIDKTARDPESGFSVLLAEVDKFKVVEGSLGRIAVDAFAAEVARRLGALTRPTDTLARLADATFAVLLDDCRDIEQARTFADRAQKALARPFRRDGQEFAITASIGIATSERGYEEAENVLRDALAAATRASKHQIERQAVFDTSQRIEGMGFLRLFAALNQAFERKQLWVAYQPILAVKGRRLVGFEALVRWDDPELGQVSPEEFIPVAEETGLIVQLGGWVLAEACRQVARWNRLFRPDPPLVMSVNLSPRQFMDAGLAERIDDVLKKVGLDGSALTLELTESAVLEDQDAAVATMRRIKQRGITLSLDDFGTGYSSISHLHELPFDTVKIDRSFIARMDEEPGGTDRVGAIIGLIHSYNMEVVAEGVETGTQLVLLEMMACEKVQGYHFSKPIGPHEAEEFIASREK